MICIGVVIGVIWLQVFLSKQKGKGLGLILPMSGVLLSVIVVIGLFMYNVPAATSNRSDIEGNIISSSQIVAQHNDVNMSSLAIGMGTTFVVSNIPTIILLCIYFGIRQQMKVDKSIEKMKVKDL